MGGCCNREEDLNNDKITSFRYTPEETNGQIKSIKTSTKPELKLEEKKLELTDEELQLSKIINELQYLYKDKVNVSVFTEIELFNLAIYYKENSVNSNYLIFDMRISSEQKEFYLKKIKHINYTFDQIKNIKAIKKYEFLKSFIDNNKIIVIIPEYYLNQKKNNEGYKKVEEYPIELCNLLYEINNNISFKILNSCLKDNSKDNLFEEYLSVFYSNDIIPFILFTYKHVTTFYKNGYFFISFLNKQIFSFEEYINNLQVKVNENNNNKNELELKDKFLNDMKITTIFNIDNNKKKELEIKDHQCQKNVFKEITINKNDLKGEIKKVNPICEWLKQEVIKGHSCYFNIENFSLNDIDNENQENNWIFVIIVIITLITEVDYKSVIYYLKEKMVYIERIDKIFDSKLAEEEIANTISKYIY